MSASTQLECGGRACPQCGKCRDWDPTYGNKYKRRDDGTCRDNTDTLYDALFRVGLAVADARPSARISARIPRDHAANRCRRGMSEHCCCRHAVDDLDAAFNAAILDGDLRDVVIDALNRAEIIASNIDLARDEDGFAILKATKAVREAQRDH
ncbi:unnamed protein product, partial [Rotaria sp. Silwood1]